MENFKAEILLTSKSEQIVRALEGDVSIDHMNEWVKPNGRAVLTSASSSSDYESGNGTSYSADMRKFRKVALDSHEYASSEFGHTSEYGLNPSSSSSEEMTKSTGIASRRHSP